MAQKGDVYDNPDDEKPAHGSATGHLWYVLRQNGEVVRSTGFSPKNSKTHDDGQVTLDDEKSYRNSPASITNRLSNLENDRTYARQMGFEPSVILMVDCITACNMLLGRYTLSAIASIALDV